MLRRSALNMRRTVVYEYSVDKAKGTEIKTYLAEIEGAHPKYRFKRRFLRRTCCSYNGKQYYKMEIGGHGVFELSIKRLDRETGNPLSQEKRWFVYYENIYYDIDKEDVLFVLFNLNLQYINKNI